MLVIPNNINIKAHTKAPTIIIGNWVLTLSDKESSTSFGG